jgi:hypothetical protein
MIGISRNSGRRPIGAWVFYLAAGSLILLGAAGLWNQIEFSLGSAPASGKVVAYQMHGAHRSSVTAEVDVSGLGPKSFRTQLEVGVGIQVGDTVDLVCTGHRCQIDSWFDRWFFILVALTSGVALLIWRIRHPVRATWTQRRAAALFNRPRVGKVHIMRWVSHQDYKESSL